MVTTVASLGFGVRHIRCEQVHDILVILLDDIALVFILFVEPRHVALFEELGALASDGVASAHFFGCNSCYLVLGRDS